MSLTNRVWVPYGKDQGFMNGYDKSKTMNDASLTEWRNADAPVTNQDVVDAIYINRDDGYRCGFAVASGLAAIAGGVAALTIWWNHRRKKKSQQAQATQEAK